jgi:hypothetical protein
METVILNIPLMFASSVSMNDGRVIVSGGATSTVGASKSDLVPVLTPKGSMYLPNMPEALRSHCMVALSDHELLVTGGWSDQTNFEVRTYYLDISNTIDVSL